MTNRVSKLQVVSNGNGINLTADSMLQRIQSFLDTENLLDVSGELEDDIDLEGPRSDERKLGPLDPFERRCFALATLLEQALNDYIVEIQAGDTERISQIMRKNKITFHAAAQQLSADATITDEHRAIINMHALTHTNLITTFDWSVRSRFSDWRSFIIVRSGFVAYAHG